jgi:hypothetical protein
MVKVSIQERLKHLSRAYHVEAKVEDVRDLEAIESSIGIALPADYKYFLMFQGAGSTLPPLYYRQFYPVRELLARNESGTPPASFEFATDDSLGFAFDLSRNKRTATYPVINYPLGETDRTDIQMEAADFEGFVAQCLDLREE